MLYIGLQGVTGVTIKDNTEYRSTTIAKYNAVYRLYSRIKIELVT